MVTLKKLFEPSLINLNHLQEIYKRGQNDTGKTADQLFYLNTDFHQIEEACKIDSVSQSFLDLLKLRRGFNELLLNKHAVRIIGNATHVNFYKINDVGVSKVVTHICQQIERIDDTLSLLDNTYDPNINFSSEDRPIADSFFSRLYKLHYDDERIFDEDVELDVFKRQIASFLKKDFNTISPELTLRVKDGRKYVAFFVITRLANFAGISNNFSALKNVFIHEIDKNGKIQVSQFNPVSRSNAFTKQINPRLSNQSSDAEFTILVKEIEELQTILGLR